MNVISPIAHRVVVAFTPELVAQLLGLPDTTTVWAVFTDKDEDPPTHCFVLVDPAFEPVPEAAAAPRISLEDAISTITQKENPHD